MRVGRVCENNLYMEYTLAADVTVVPRPADDRASAHGLDPVTIDGNDVEAVRAVATAAVECARAGEGPSLVEAPTYRHGGHAMADPAKYRPAGELERWRERDPTSTYRRRLIARGISERVLETLDEDVSAEVDAAADEAERARQVSDELLLTNMWADGGSQWRN